MSRARGVNVDWNIYDDEGNTGWEKVPIAVLMDIRDEPRSLNRLLNCVNFVNIPRKLDRIGRNTTRKPRGKRADKSK